MYCNWSILIIYICNKNNLIHAFNMNFAWATTSLVGSYFYKHIILGWLNPNPLLLKLSCKVMGTAIHSHTTFMTFIDYKQFFTVTLTYVLMDKCKQSRHPHGHIQISIDSCYNVSHNSFYSVIFCSRETYS